MKKQRLLLTLFSIALLLYSTDAFAGCGVSPSVFCLISSNSSDIVTVTAPDSSCGAWTAISNNTDWIRVISGASGSGNGTATISWSKNTTGVERTATITIAGQTVNVTQSAEGQDICVAALTVLSMTPLNLSLHIPVIITDSSKLWGDFTNTPDTLNFKAPIKDMGTVGYNGSASTPAVLSGDTLHVPLKLMGASYWADFKAYIALEETGWVVYLGYITAGQN